jgi:hypothetical protein
MTGCGWSQAERAMWPMRVVVLDVDAPDLFELFATGNQEPVEAVAADGADPALGECVRVRRAKRCADDLDGVAFEDLVEGAAGTCCRGRGSGTESGSGVRRVTRRAGGPVGLSKGLWGAKTLSTELEMPDLQAKRNSRHPQVEVAAVEDQQPIEGLGADGADDALRDAFAFGARTGVVMIWMPSLAKMASKSRVNLLSRSRIRNRNGDRWCRSVHANWRACWVTQAPVGLAVQPARWTRRLLSSMKKSTYSR